MALFVDYKMRRRKRPLMSPLSVKHLCVGGILLWDILTKRKNFQKSLVKWLLKLAKGSKLFGQE
jgi:hypothetical protein